eukprot:12338392-Alexandrium_andersonii.AAC.1
MRLWWMRKRAVHALADGATLKKAPASQQVDTRGPTERKLGTEANGRQGACAPLQHAWLFSIAPA